VNQGERHIDYILCSVMRAGELPDRVLYVAWVTTRLGFDQKADGAALNLGRVAANLNLTEGTYRCRVCS